MKQVFTSNKSIDTLYKDLEQSIANNKFGLIHTHNLNEKFEAKNLEFNEKYLILDICNPMIAKSILEIDMSVGASLPCSISLYTDKGTTCIAMTKPTIVYPMLNEKLKELSEVMESTLVKIINEAIV